MMALFGVNSLRQSVADGAECSSDHITDLVKRAKSVKNYLHAITVQLEEFPDEKEDFIHVFPQWKSYRIRSIDFLTNVIEELDKIHFNTNIAKATASVGGIISACVGIASSAAQLSSHSSADPLRLAACCGNLISATVNAGAAATEAGLAKARMGKVKRLLLEDRERLEALQIIFKLFEKLTRNIDTVCNSDAIPEIFQKLLSISTQVKNVCDTASSAVGDIIKQVIQVLQKRNKGISHSEIEKIVLLCYSVCENPELLETIKKIYQTIQTSPSIMPVVTSTVKVTQELPYLIRRIGGSAENPSARKDSLKDEALTYGVFQGVNIALEIFSLTLLADDFEKGSPSSYSDEIKNVRDRMKLELEIISDVYKKLKQTS